MSPAKPTSVPIVPLANLSALTVSRDHYLFRSLPYLPVFVKRHGPLFSTRYTLFSKSISRYLQHSQSVAHSLQKTPGGSIGLPNQILGVAVTPIKSKRSTKSIPNPNGMKTIHDTPGGSIGLSNQILDVSVTPTESKRSTKIAPNPNGMKTIHDTPGGGGSIGLSNQILGVYVTQTESKRSTKSALNSHRMQTLHDTPRGWGIMTTPINVVERATYGWTLPRTASALLRVLFTPRRERQHRDHPRPRIPAGNFQRPAQLPHPLLHPAQTHARSRFHVPGGLLRLQPFSLVRNFHAHRAILRDRISIVAVGLPECR